MSPFPHHGSERSAFLEAIENLFLQRTKLPSTAVALAQPTTGSSCSARSFIRPRIRNSSDAATVPFIPAAHDLTSARYTSFLDVSPSRIDHSQNDTHRPPAFDANAALSCSPLPTTKRTRRSGSPHDYRRCPTSFDSLDVAGANNGATAGGQNKREDYGAFFHSQQSTTPPWLPPVRRHGMRGPSTRTKATASSFIMRFYSHIDKAASTSTYTEGELQDTFAADKALSLGSGYWCSTGKHTASEVVSYAGELKHRKKVSGVKVFWAYAPGKVQIRTSPDGAHWSTVIPFHASPRAEVTYEQNLLFDKQRNVKKISVDMTNPRPWGFFGINQISLLR